MCYFYGKVSIIIVRTGSIIFCETYNNTQFRTPAILQNNVSELIYAAVSVCTPQLQLHYIHNTAIYLQSKPATCNRLELELRTTHI